MEVGCQWARGLQLQLHPKVEEHSQAYQPASQPQAPLHPGLAPTIVAPITLSQKPSGSKMHKPLNKKKKNPGKEGETLNQESRGRGTKRNATLLERHTMLTKLGVQYKHNVGTWLTRITVKSLTVQLADANSPTYKIE